MRQKKNPKSSPGATAAPKSRDVQPVSVLGAKTPTLADMAYDTIRRDILSLQLHPGQKVSEALLSERYGLGKAPIRSALSRLVQDGMIENHRRSGHIVAPITLEDIRNLFLLRRMTIPEAAFLASGNPTGELRAAHQRVIDIDFSGPNVGDILAFCFANRDFIVALGNASRNGLLASWMATLEDRYLRVLFLGTRSLPSAEAYRADYDNIWAGVVSGRGAEARQAVLEALAGTEKIVTDAVLKMPELQTLNLGELLGPL